jgi:uncharacterized membrane protein
MPFCTQCGHQVHETDFYCARCGTRQMDIDESPPHPGGAAQGAVRSAGDGITPRTASILCYIPLAGWIASIFVLASAKFRTSRYARFHAFQGLYLFVAWLLVQWVVAPIFSVGGFRGDDGIRIFQTVAVVGILRAILLGVWIFMIIKASQEEMYRLPVIGELAERSLSEGS